MIRTEEGGDEINIMFDEENIDLIVTVNDIDISTEDFIKRYNRLFENLIYNMMELGVHDNDDAFILKVKTLYVKFKGLSMNIKVASERTTNELVIFVNDTIWDLKVFRKVFPEDFEEILDNGMKVGLEEENYMLCKKIQDLKNEFKDI